MARTLRVLLAGALFVPLVAGAYGGWATVTLEDLPDRIVAREPITLTFTVRQHGFEKIGGLKARVEARSGKLEASALALPSGEIGSYAATLSLPQPGEWTITIHSGFGNSRATLLPLVVAESGKAVAALTGRERGRHLFVAKGCFSCHVHRDIDRPSIEVGPDLTGRQFAADYLNQFLSNPAMRVPQRGTLGMPNLNLKQPEIVALTAFLNGSAVNQAKR